jgi:hypothetical protein
VKYTVAAWANFITANIYIAEGDLFGGWFLPLTLWFAVLAYLDERTS